MLIPKLAGLVRLGERFGARNDREPIASQRVFGSIVSGGFQELAPRVDVQVAMKRFQSAASLTAFSPYEKWTSGHSLLYR